MDSPTLREHFAYSTSFYNNILALGAFAVDNGKGGGWDSGRDIHGPHCVKLSGRTQHWMPSTKQGGLYYFTFDAL